MNEIKIFNHEVFGDIRTLTNERGEPLFVGKDVATALGYRNPSNALQVHVDDEDKTSYLIQVPGSNYKANTLMINESGLYSLILSSKLPTAKASASGYTSPSGNSTIEASARCTTDNHSAPHLWSLRSKLKENLF